MPRWSHSSMKCAPFCADSREQHAVVGDDADRVPVEAGEAGDERLAVLALELVELAAVDEPRDDLAHVVGLVARRRARRRTARPASTAGGDGSARHPTPARRRRQRRDDVAHDLERVLVVLGEVVDDAGAARVQLAAAELLGGDDLADRGLHERRAAEEDRALVAHDHGLVAHRGHVRAAGGARAEHGGDLRDAGGRHPRLVEEDAPEVVAVGEDLVLHRQERAARVDEVDARAAGSRARSPARAGASSRSAGSTCRP